MDRWNELIAGHVLGNLTAEESEELAQILVKHPQLNAGILRLRQTATLRGGLSENRMSDHMADYTVPSTIPATNAEGYVTAGAEGWTDGISGGPSPVRLQVNPIKVNSVLEQGKHTLHRRSQTEPSPSAQPKNNNNSRTWINACTKESLKNPLWWILVLATIGLGIDNMRMRRSLTRIKDQTTYTHIKKTPPALWSPSDNQLSTQ